MEDLILRLSDDCFVLIWTNCVLVASRLLLFDVLNRSQKKLNIFDRIGRHQAPFFDGQDELHMFNSTDAHVIGICISQFLACRI